MIESVSYEGTDLLTRQLKGSHRIEKGLSPAALFRCSRHSFYCRVSSADGADGITAGGDLAHRIAGRDAKSAVFRIGAIGRGP